MTSDAPHRYQAQRERIDALAELATRQAKLSDRLASRCDEERSRHLADFDRMVRMVRAAAAWVVRLDQAGEGKLPIRDARRIRLERRFGDAGVGTEEAQPYLPSLPNLPDLPSSRPERSPERAEPGPGSSNRQACTLQAKAGPASAPEPQAASEPKPQWQIHREALQQKRRAQGPPLRRSG